MTESPRWWKLQSGSAKAITILAALCVLEIGLCTALPYGSSLGPWLGPLFFLTALGLLIAFLIWMFKS